MKQLEFYFENKTPDSKLSIEQKEEIGKKLFNILYIKVYKKDIFKMYEDFKKLTEYIDSYGETIDQKVRNYCYYKYDNVANRYGIKIIIMYPVEEDEDTTKKTL